MLIGRARISGVLLFMLAVACRPFCSPRRLSASSLLMRPPSELVP
jgi:hypothetical protein